MVPYPIARFLRRVRLLLHRRAFERDLDEEMRFHMEMAEARHLERGVTPAAVRPLIAKEFGSMDRYKDEVRDARGLTLSDDVGRDLRFAVRTLRRTPGFTLIALLTFGLGIGANAAIFSVVNAVVLRGLPYPNAPRLVRTYEQVKGQPALGAASVLNWQDWQRDVTAFEALGGFVPSGAILGGDAEPERVRATYVSAEVLPMLGVKPMLGRWFGDEDVRDKQNVVIVSEALWRSRYGAERGIVGSTIRIEGLPFTVVGVMPASFNFPLGPLQTQLWMPFVPPDMALDPRARGWHWISAVGLLKPGVTVRQANADLVRVAARLEQANPGSNANRSAAVVPLRDDVVGRVRPTLLVLLGAVVLVLIIACANVANLLLARNAARRKDAAVRVALGASRGQLVRQRLVESIVLALGGALLGLAFAYAGLRVLATLSGTLLPIVGPIPMDARVLAVLAAAAIVCGLAFGIAPAMQGTRGGVRHDLAGLTVKTTAGTEMRRFRSALVVTQIALSLMLLVGAGLLLRAFVTLQSTDSGLTTDRVLTARLAVPHRFSRDNNTETEQLLRPLLERVRAIPGVRQAGIVSLLPVEETGAQASFWVDGRPWPKAGTEPFAEVRTVSPGYFATMGVPLKAGRDLEERDDSTSVTKVIVNEALARKFFPGENPIGRHLLQGSADQHFAWEIVGVSGDVRQSGLAEAPRVEIYTSYEDMRANFARGDVALVVKTSVAEASIAPEVRRALKAVAPDAALMNVRPMDEVIAQSLASRKLILLLFGAFAGIALMLAASGLYGVIYYLVAQRTREIGIRMALGADRAKVVRLVLRQGAALALGGIVVGLFGAVMLSRLLAGLLYGVGTHDPVTFVTVPVVLATVALVASLVPAWRAARVDPVVALRTD